MAKDTRRAGLGPLGRAVSKESKSVAAEKAKAHADVEAVIQRFKEDPSAWEKLSERLQRASDDDERARLLIDFALSEEELRQMLPPDGSGQVAGTPTITTITVTTVTTV